MVISSAPQPPNSYVLGKRFSLPVGSHTYDAVAISSTWESKLTSLNTLLVGNVVLNIWCILFAGALVTLLRRGHVLPLSTALWNKRGSMTNSFWEILPDIQSQWKNWQTYPFILALMGFWLLQVALQLIIPSWVFIDHAAPVDACSIFAPSYNDTTKPIVLQDFISNAPAVLRAVGSALVASNETKSRVATKYTPLPSTTNQQIGGRFDYWYHITGIDFGLQKYPDLRLSVNGSCRTEYGWLDQSKTGVIEVQVGSSRYNYSQDTYNWLAISIAPRSKHQYSRMVLRLSRTSRLGI